MSGFQSVSPWVLELPSESPSWIAVTGLQFGQRTLLSQAVMDASALAAVTRAKSRALRDSLNIGSLVTAEEME